MEEKNYKINWLGLFIKVIIFVIILLFAIWLVAKIVKKDKGLSFEENNKLFQEASVEYFKKNLPKEDKTITVTLKQLITWDYLKELKTDGKICDAKNSKAKIELIEDYYSIKTEFVCKNQSETTHIKLGNENCENCDIKIAGLKINKKEEIKEEEKQENNNNSNPKGSVSTPSENKNITSNSQNNQEPTKIILYEYVKEINEYSDWYTGKVTGKNIENSKKTVSYSKFCKRKDPKDCAIDKTENSKNYIGYLKVKTWNEEIDIYRYIKTISEYKYSNAESLEGYIKTGKTKIVD